MKAVVEILVMLLVSVTASDPRMGWIDVCSYSDPIGSTCCSSGMENKEYLVVPEIHDWYGHSVACRHYGGGRGWLAVFEEPEEGSCIQHYILNAWEPSYQRYAISLRHPFTMPGIYHWWYPDGSLVQPDYTEWAFGHPIDRGCVSMLLGSGVVHQGSWLDTNCVEDTGLFAVCEREKICALEGGSCATDNYCCEDLSCDAGTCRQSVSGLIISGGNGYDDSVVGKSVEVYVPSTGQHCQLADLPARRDHHSMEKTVVCGGYPTIDTETSCLTLTADGWEVTTTLLEERDGHCSWASPSGVIVIGGDGSRGTTEKIREQDGSSSGSFDLKYDINVACAINLGSSVILTGGVYSYTRVSEYNEAGWVSDLPDLLQGRKHHGCSFFDNDEETKTYLVSGGFDYARNLLSSTELLVGTASAWVNTGELPSPRSILRGANIDNMVLMTGGTDGSEYDEILEFDPLTGQWKLVDRMIQARHAHAVSVIDFDSGLCV